MTKYALTRDIVFKAVFGRDTKQSNYTLIHLLNSILEPTGHPHIKTVYVKNPYVFEGFSTEKVPILDIKATIDSGEQINIEVQSHNETYFTNRMVYYLAKLHGGQLEYGNQFQSITKTIQIQITSFCIKPSIKKLHTWYRLKEATTGEELCDDLELHCVQLPCIRDIIDLEQMSPLEEWLTLIKDIDNPIKQDFIQALRKKKEVIDVAVQEYKRVTSNSYLREQIEAIEKAEHETASRLYAAEEKGKAEEKRQTAKRLKDRGMAAADIAAITDLSIEEIIKL